MEQSRLAVMHRTQVGSGVLFVILAVVLKTGLGPFFMWKRDFFKSLDARGLIVYLALYLSVTILFTLSLTLCVACANRWVAAVLYLVVALSLVAAKLTSNASVNVYSFFAISTLYNAALALCASIVELNSASWAMTFQARRFVTEFI